MQVRVSEKIGTCGCGRSPTGDCIGWHGLSESDYKAKLEEWNINEASKLIAEETLQATDDELEAYKKQAQALWSDSCTTGRAE